MKSTTLHPREILAWIVLAFAIILFSVTVSLAQDTKEKKPEIKIKIQKDVDGKKTNIDTTITADQLPALKEYLKDMDIDFDAAGDSENGKGDGGNMVLRFNHQKMNKEEREDFEKDMEKLNDEMKDLDHEMQDIHIEIQGSNDNDPENFDLHVQSPPSPGTPMPPNAFYFHDDGDCGKTKKFSYHYKSYNDEIPDSLQDENHIAIRGHKGEDAPVLEKEITTKDGEKVFIYKRTLPKQERSGVTASVPVTRVKVYPNPGNGKFTVSFTSISKGDVLISITDEKGSEVYRKSLEDFSGEFSSQVDISGKGKGTYYLKVSQGDDSVTKKILVE